MSETFTLCSLTELRDALRRNDLSPVELTQAYLERIDRLNPTLHAYLDVYADAALSIARASEARLASGLPTGLLEGVPVALKDLLDIEGRRTTAGSTVHASREAARRSSTVAARLMNAGAIPLGKTHLVEFAFGGWGTNAGLGTPRNPWDMRAHRAPGGSSSGSAVAVAGGLAAGAIGTDTGGSVRIPSAFCGLTGLKTTQGRVSTFGCEYVSHTLDTIGPMAWTAEDAALLLQVIHGPDPLEATTLCRGPEDFLAGLRGPVAGLRISVPARQSLGHVEDAVWEAVSLAALVLEELGCLRTDDAFAGVDFVADQEATGVIIACEAFAHHGALLGGTLLPGDPAARARVLRGGSIPAAGYIDALRHRVARQRQFVSLFEQTDVLVLPTVPVTAPTLERIDEADLSHSRLTRFVGYYGLSAIALPCGLSHDGLPMSLQLVAAPFKEALLLRMGAAFQKRTEHHQQRPAMATTAPARGLRPPACRDG